MSSIYSAAPSAAYGAVRQKLSAGDCVLLDGGVATELQAAHSSEDAGRREPWGVWALYNAHTKVLDVHRRYVAAGCDVLSTNSWSILEEADRWGPDGPPRAWAEAADAAVRLPRAAIAEAGQSDHCAVAFCINGDLRASRALGALELLTWRWMEDAPDLVIFETLEHLPDQRLLEAVSMVIELGLPVWVSMRRDATGMASVDGHSASRDASGELAAALAELERRHVGAVLVNCVPRHRMPGAVETLAATTSMPVGCLPNLGHPEDNRWRQDDVISPEEFARETLEWIERGARIVGGCCGVGPQHINEVRHLLDSALAWSARGV